MSIMPPASFKKSHIGLKILLLSLLLSAAGAVPVYAGQDEYKQDELIVKFRPGTTQTQVDRANRHAGGRKAGHIGAAELVALDLSATVPTALIKYMTDPAVEYAEPDYVYKTMVTTPNDTFYSAYQWNMRITGANVAWDTWKGNSSVTIAIIDSGVSLNHPDLVGKIVAGYDFVENDSNPTDEHGHGTHVAGIAAATTNNATGVAGVDWNARIMPIRVLDASGSGFSSDVADGIYWAVGNGAKVINMSLGDTAFSQTVQNAIDYAYEEGVTVVAAAGNSGNSIPMYPAAGAHVISVAATDSGDNRASFSNYNNNVDVAAPGLSIASTYWSASSGNSYVLMSGTSMASPHVAGLASLLASRNPAWTPAQIETAIETSATDRGTAGKDPYYGYGRININAAVNSEILPDHFTVIAGAAQTAGAAFSVTITAKDDDNNTLAGFTGRANLSDSSGTISTSQTGNFTAGIWTGNVSVTKAGQDTITASYYAGTGVSAAFTVNPGPPNLIVVTPESTVVNRNGAMQVTAAATDAFNNPISAPFTWSATRGSFNPLTGAGSTYNASQTTGPTILTAALGAVSGSATINVIGDYALDIFYNYGSATAGVWMMYTNGTSLLAPVNVWASAAGSWDAARSRPLIGDYNNDTIDDIIIFYDYGNATSAVWGMAGNSASFSSPTLIWSSGAGNWESARSTPAIGDYNGDSKDDIVIFYDYGSSTSGVWVMENIGSGFDIPQQKWISGPGSWEARRSKPLVGDYNNDLKDDIVIFYDYGNATSAVWGMPGDGTSFDDPIPIWSSGAGNWEAARSNVLVK